ncbi:MAG: phenylalanine--tRNA ligase subunit beta [Candidatus Gracilibacteria bacterium]
MKISLNWIKDYVDIPAKYSAKELAELLTLRTCEVEGFEDQARGLSGVVIGEMLEFHKHPNAEKLNVAKMDIGRSEPLNLVFGSMVTMHVGDRIPVAVAPTVLPTGMEILAKDLRGARSEGMLCLEQELGMKETGVSILYFPKTKPGTPVAEALELNDTIFEIDNKSLTHRPDLWGHYGLAREFAGILGKKLKPMAPKVAVPKTGQKAKVDLPKEDIAKRFLACIMTGIKIEESPMWLKNRLQAAGMRPVNNIVDITNYVMLGTGHPMHAFDRKFVGTDTLAVRFAKTGENIETLDHKKRMLSTQDALITNGKMAMGIAGVMGGVNSEITNSTNEVILEVATWNPVMIRKTEQRHGLRTDAAQRFEKSLDPEVAGTAMLFAIELILKICKGSVLAGPITDIYQQKPKAINVEIDVDATNKKIGVNLTGKDMAGYLTPLGFEVKEVKKGTLKITVPSWRATKDINIEDDIVEEVARMHGYEKIVPTLPHLPIKIPMENRERTLKHKARQILSGSLGFNELNLYSFYGATEVKKCQLPENLHVLLENPLTDDQTHMRISLLPNILKTIPQNLTARDHFKFYEIGRTYIKTGELFPREEKFICGVVVNKDNKCGEIFYEALGSLQSFLKLFQATTPIIDTLASPPPYAHPTKAAALKCGKEEIAVVYEIHPQVLKNFGIESPVAAFEINFTKMVAGGICAKSFAPMPKYPGIEIDVSVLVEKNTTVREVSELIRTSEQNLIAKISLIDIFEDKSLGEGKKSFTFRVLLQSPERTLTDEEMKKVQTQIFKNLRGRHFEIRGA